MSKGTKDPKYHESRVREDTSFVTLKDICGMKDYQGKDVSELRLEDYTLGRKGICNVPQQPEAQPLQFMSFAQPQMPAPVLQQMPPQPSYEQQQQYITPVEHEQLGRFEKPANTNDPFLIDEIKIDRVELPAQPVRKRIPRPDFKREEMEHTLRIVLREPAVRSEIETIPSQEDIRKTESTNLIVVFNDGRIEYLEKIRSGDALLSNIESKVFFNKGEVSVNDMVGMGLNKRARVYVNNYFPFSKASRSFVKDDAIVYELKKDPKRRFVEYDKESGLYVYEVNHF